MERMINQFSRSGRSLGWGRALLAAVAILGSALLPLPAAQASPGNGLDARVAAPTRF